MEVVNALGRRKSAVARIYLKDGKGKITVNDRELQDYFPLQQLQYIIQQPLNLAEVADQILQETQWANPTAEGGAEQKGNCQDGNH